jgi:hypothetical protein
MALRRHVQKIDFPELTRLQKVHVSVTESIARTTENSTVASISPDEQSQLSLLKPLKMVLSCYYDGVPLKCKKKNNQAAENGFKLLL